MRCDDILELAHGARDPSETFQRLLGALRNHFDADVAQLHVQATFPITGGGPIATLGFDAARLNALANRWPRYVAELDALRTHAHKTQDVVSESDVFARSELEARAFYRELMAPEGGKQSLVAYLPWRGAATAAVMLGSRKHSFTIAQRVALRDLVPALAVCIAAAPTRTAFLPLGVQLTPREQEVLGYLEAGLGNPDIARCLGSSVNTVRNQVASMLAKLQLDSRTQLAGYGLSQFRIVHR